MIFIFCYKLKMQNLIFIYYAIEGFLGVNLVVYVYDMIFPKKYTIDSPMLHDKDETEDILKIE